MALSRFHAGLQARQMCEVQMNQVQFITFTSSIRAIGTRHLNGCTAVAIVSPFGAILAHIAPLPYFTSDPNAGLRNVQAKMSEVVSIYRQNQALFPSRSSLVVWAEFGGDVALRDQLDCIQGLLMQNGLMPAMALYEATAGGHFNAAKGTVFIDAGQGSPLVYVEDRRVEM